MSLSRRQFGSGVAACIGATLFSTPAFSSTLVALSLDELEQKSSKVVLATPEESLSNWEYVAGQRRIVTRTRALIHEVWLDRADSAGEEEPDTQELHLLTWGGRVGDIAQRVHGEAILTANTPCLLFSSRAQMGMRRIVGMAQGYYPIAHESGTTRLRPSPGLPPLARRNNQPGPLAVETLRGLDLSHARQLLGAKR